MTFFEVPPGQGDIRFGTYDFSLGDADLQGFAGFAYNPYVLDDAGGAVEDEIGGDVFIDRGVASVDLLLHEIGHALGLKHPFEGELTLDPALDDLSHTVMTYNQTGGPATGLGSLDVEAIQSLYGPPNAGGTQAATWSWDSARFVLTQTGGPFADSLAGVATDDRISSGTGDDYVFTRGGDDSIHGGGGQDTLAGGDGHDTR